MIVEVVSSSLYNSFASHTETFHESYLFSIYPNFNIESVFNRL